MSEESMFTITVPSEGERAVLEYFLLECQPDYLAAQFVAAWSRPGTGG